ncbi:hypothetical protein BCR39DRAFT_556195 [Naematelia encephala]|uniref:Uncharacterized protein n=1 Tax=Naematelia encephala TaxID=71784 RepID=A0A1Y2BIR1_9TREE|nr:hypothetical protein BCR39DRAFT_556195 [Naematelia encephala]
MITHFLVVFLFVSTALAQSSGTITISATPPSDNTPNSGCIVLAQVASLNGPTTLTASKPICPNTATIPSPDGGVVLDWPLTSGGDGSASSIAIYGQITSDSGSSPATAQAGCVMTLSQMQAMYLLGRTLEWAKTEPNELYDDTAGGVLLDPTTYQPIMCGANANLLPAGLKLPDPYALDGSNEAWNTPITLVNSSVSSTSVGSGTTTTSDAPTPSTTLDSSSQLSPSSEISPSSTVTPSQSPLASSPSSIASSTSSTWSSLTDSTSASASFAPPSSSASFAPPSSSASSSAPTTTATAAQQNVTSVPETIDEISSTATALANIDTSSAVTSIAHTSSSASISTSVIQISATQGTSSSTDSGSTFFPSPSSESQQDPSSSPSSSSHNIASTTDLTPSVQTTSTFVGNSTLSRSTLTSTSAASALSPEVSHESTAAGVSSTTFQTSSRFSSKSSSDQAIATSVTSVSVSGLPPSQSVRAASHTKASSSASILPPSLNSRTTTTPHTTIVNFAPSSSVSKSTGKTTPKLTSISKTTSNTPVVIFTDSKGSTIGQFQPATTSRGTGAPEFNGSSSDVLIEEMQNQTTSSHHSLEPESSGKDRKPGVGGGHGVTSKDPVLIASTTSLGYGGASSHVHVSPVPSKTQSTGPSQLPGNEVLNVLSGSSISPTDSPGGSCKRNKKRLNTDGG